MAGPDQDLAAAPAGQAARVNVLRERLISGEAGEADPGIPRASSVPGVPDRARS